MAIGLPVSPGSFRFLARATFNGAPYDRSRVYMGIKNPDGSVYYIVGIRKDIRAKIGKQSGDTRRVTIQERENNHAKI